MLVTYVGHSVVDLSWALTFDFLVQQEGGEKGCGYLNA